MGSLVKAAICTAIGIGIGYFTSEKIRQITEEYKNDIDAACLNDYFISKISLIEDDNERHEAIKEYLNRIHAGYRAKSIEDITECEKSIYNFINNLSSKADKEETNDDWIWEFDDEGDEDDYEESESEENEEDNTIHSEMGILDNEKVESDDNTEEVNTYEETRQRDTTDNYSSSESVTNLYDINKEELSSANEDDTKQLNDDTTDDTVVVYTLNEDEIEEDSIEDVDPAVQEILDRAKKQKMLMNLKNKLLNTFPLTYVPKIELLMKILSSNETNESLYNNCTKRLYECIESHSLESFDNTIKEFCNEFK